MQWHIRGGSEVDGELQVLVNPSDTHLVAGILVCQEH